MSATHPAKAISSAVRAELARRDMTRRELAEQVGVGTKMISLLMVGTVRSPKLERKIEMALGTPFWSNPAQFIARQPVVKFYGTDPEALTLPELDQLATKYLPLKERRRLFASRPAYIKRLVEIYEESTNTIAALARPPAEIA